MSERFNTVEDNIMSPDDLHAFKTFKKNKALHLCPVCNGRCLVPNGFYTDISKDRCSTSTSAEPETCRSCDGKGYIVL